MTLSWRRGLFRSWLVLSLLWAAMMVFENRPDRDLRIYLRMIVGIERAQALVNAPSDPVTLPDGTISSRANVAADLVLIQERQSERLTRLADFTKITAGPIFGLLMIGLLAGWAFAGFIRKVEE